MHYHRGQTDNVFGLFIVLDYHAFKLVTGLRGCVGELLNDTVLRS